MAAIVNRYLVGLQDVAKRNGKLVRIDIEQATEICRLVNSFLPTTVERILVVMNEPGDTTPIPPDIPGFPKDWREQIKAVLAAQLDSGGTLYDVRSDGAYIARTSEGDRVISLPDRDCL